MEAAFWVTFSAALSDALDGIIAKRFKMVSVLGGFLDPIADKALLVCVFIALGHEGYLPIWLVILVVFRDILIIGGAVLFQTITQSLEMRPLIVSKINTALQLLLLVLVLASEAFGSSLNLARYALVYIVATTTFLSGLFYVFEWTKMASEMEKSDNQSRGDQ
tara:strand:+ start:1372 stop:1860 length:489 start_codon:yes stop_codon:yes gene_type:complete